MTARQRKQELDMLYQNRANLDRLIALYEREMKKDPPTITVRQASERYNIKGNTINDWIKRGWVDAVKDAKGHYLINEIQFETFINQ